MYTEYKARQLSNFVVAYVWMVRGVGTLACLAVLQAHWGAPGWPVSAGSRLCQAVRPLAVCGSWLLNALATCSCLPSQIILPDLKANQ